MRATRLSFSLLALSSLLCATAHAEERLRCKRYEITVTENFCQSATGLCTSGVMYVGKATKRNAFKTALSVDAITPGPGGTMGYNGTWSAEGERGSIKFTMNGILDPNNGGDISMNGGVQSATGVFANVVRAYFDDSMFQSPSGFPGFHGAAIFCTPNNGDDDELTR